MAKAADQRNKDQAMAAHLIARGIFHGKRTTTPRHANYPKITEVGSAAYRRLQESQRPKY